MNKTQKLTLTITLVASLSTAPSGQAYQGKTGKIAPGSVAQKVDHKVKLNKPGLAGGLGEVSLAAAPMALGTAAEPDFVLPEATTPGDFVYYQNGVRLSPRGVAGLVSTGSINRDGSVTARGTANHVEAQAIGPMHPATPNQLPPSQDPAMTQVPVPQTVTAPALLDEGKRAKNPVPDFFAQTNPGTVTRPQDFPIKPYLEYTIPTVTSTRMPSGRHVVSTEAAQRNPAITNPDGSLTLHAIDTGWTVRVVNQDAPHLAPQPQATPNQLPPSQDPAITQVPVPQTVQAPALLGEGKRAKDPVPEFYAQTNPGTVTRPQDFPIKPYLEYTIRTVTSTRMPSGRHVVSTEAAQRNPAITNPDGSLTLHAIDTGWTVRVVNQDTPHLAPQPQATPNQLPPSQDPAMTQVPVPQTIHEPNLVPQPQATPNPLAPSLNPGITQAPVPLTVQAPNLVPQSPAVPNQLPPSLDPAMTQVPVPQTIREPNLVPQPQATPNPLAPSLNPGITQAPVPLTVQAPDLVPQSPAVPNQLPPSMDPAVTQVPVPQTVHSPDMAKMPRVEVYTSLHGFAKPHERAYDQHDSLFHLVIVGFREP